MSAARAASIRSGGRSVRACARSASTRAQANASGLAAAESNPDVEYVAAFVSPRADKPVDLSAGPAAAHIMKMRDRMSFMRTREIREERLKTASAEEQFRHNAWEMTGLADPTKPVVVPDLLASKGWTDLDYLKIDTDGIDWEILQSFDGRLAPLHLLAVQLEVNFIGDGSAEEHAFHNTDRFMRRAGLRPVPAGRAQLLHARPARALHLADAGRDAFGSSVPGRGLLRAGPHSPHRRLGFEAMSVEKVAKLAAILSAWEVPDAAAELLLHYREKLASTFDVDRGLDLLAAQAQPERARPLSYRDYMARFETDPPDFYRPEGPIPSRRAPEGRLARLPIATL